MNSTSLGWLAGLFIGSISLNLGLLKIIYDDTFAYPNRISLTANALLSFVGGFFIFYVAGAMYSIAFILFNVLSFLLMFYFTKRRTVYALELGEKLLAALKTIDLQLTYILSEMHHSENSDAAKPIRRAVRFILAELPDILGLNGDHHPQLCVLIPHENKFTVVAYERIESFRIEEMEKLFRYGPNPVSVAGRAMNQRRMVIINDLSKEEYPGADDWIKTYRDEQKKGSILAFPIMRGLASLDAEPIAILCITSAKKGAFKDENTLIRVLTYFSVKIEMLQNCLDLTQRL